MEEAAALGKGAREEARGWILGRRGAAEETGTAAAEQLGGE